MKLNITDNQKDTTGETTDIKSFHPDYKALNSPNINNLHRFPENTGSQTGHDFSLENSLFQALEEISKEKKMFFTLPKSYIDYVPPKLHRGRTSWYISYYVKNPETGKLKLFRIKVNRFHSPRERIHAAKEIMAGLSERLAMGWNPLLITKAPMTSVPVFQVFSTYLKVKEKEMESQSYATYASYIRIFKTWLAKEGCQDSTPICIITEPMARLYMNYLESGKGLSPRSYNNYLSFMVTFYDWLKDKGYVHANIFAGLKRKPRRLMAKKRRMLTDKELATLFSWGQENNPEYLAACLLCYCCFMRPKEIALLRCQDIDLQKQLVHVRADIAKNDRESFRTIPDAMMPVMQHLDLSRPERFLFGYHVGHSYDFRPSAVAGAKKRFSDYWAHTVRDACHFSKDVQLYSLKDTGITNMLSEGMAINLVQQQADHSSVAMTAIYVGHKATASEEIKSALSLP